VVDTGGWQAKPSANLDEMVKQQVEAAIAEADIIIFVVDAKDGLFAADEEIADMLRAVNKPIVLAANKIDSVTQVSPIADFYHLGIGTPIGISAYHNQGIDELMHTVLAFLPKMPATSVNPAELKLAIV
jgi:GTP-binding protein